MLLDSGSPKKGEGSSNQQYNFCSSNTGDQGFHVSNLSFIYEALVYTMNGYTRVHPKFLEPSPSLL